MTGNDFDGLVAAVTGGASGIGLATANEMAARGATVAILDLQGASHDGPHHLVVADVTDDASIRSAIDDVARRFGGIDILINNAGIGAVGTVEDNSDDEWLHVMDVNVMGVVRASRAAVPYLRKSAHAAIVNTCSICAIAGLPQRALYGATKGAVQGLTLAMAADYAREGIRVNLVNPGTVHTPFVDRNLANAADPVAELAALSARHPMGRLMTAQEVAFAIAYLASPLASSTTGTILAVDGGLAGLRLRPV